MDEQKIFSIELDGLFPEYDTAPRVSGTAGEILERIADEYGLEDEDPSEIDFPLDGVYPSTRAFRAKQLVEDRLQKSADFDEPDALIGAMMEEGLARHMTDDEFDEYQDELELDEYNEARSELDEEWQDGLWEN